ncbi:MOSC domain-containing protein [Staphylococcus massiliensis]|uniref:MOSC domain-containing protein n=1 Tax=Staphylococcus massiliensis TaxID=555791 RepID=UPI00370DD89E
MNYQIIAISTGKINEVPYGQDKAMSSAIMKKPIQQSMFLSKTGFVEDEQQYHSHGGPDKDVCIFSKHNYHMWQADIDPMPEYAMFGENLTIEKIDESDLYFGNQYQLGEAIIEVSEIREPCWKIQSLYGVKDLVKRMSQTGKTGCYMRVIQEGHVKPDDHMKLVKEAEPATRLSIADINDVFYVDRKNIVKLEYALRNPYITDERRQTLEKRLAKAKK